MQPGQQDDQKLLPERRQDLDPDRTKWTGCVTDRTHPYNGKNVDTVATGNAPTLFPAKYYENSEYYCKPGNNPPQQLMPLSYDWSAINDDHAMQRPAANQPIGIAWAGIAAADPAALRAGRDPNYTYKKALIVLSDGLTRDRWPADGNANTQWRAIDKFSYLCTDQQRRRRLRDPAQHRLPGSDSTALQNCASSATVLSRMYDKDTIPPAYRPHPRLHGTEYAPRERTATLFPADEYYENSQYYCKPAITRRCSS